MISKRIFLPTGFVRPFFCSLVMDSRNISTFLSLRSMNSIHLVIKIAQGFPHTTRCCVQFRLITRQNYKKNLIFSIDQQSHMVATITTILFILCYHLVIHLHSVSMDSKFIQIFSKFLVTLLHSPNPFKYPCCHTQIVLLLFTHHYCNAIPCSHIKLVSVCIRFRSSCW